MYIKGKYRGGDSIATLLLGNYSILVAMRCFDLPLGVAEKSIDEVCEENGVSAKSFLAVANLMLRHNDWSYTPSLEGVEAMAIVNYLRSAHRLFLDVKLPKIRKELLTILRDSKMSKLIMKHFDDYVQEAMQHMQHEESTLFAYVEALSRGEHYNFSIERYMGEHDNKVVSFELFQDVIIRYFRGNDDDIIGVIHDFLSYDNSLKWHTMVEDRLLVPLIQKMERE